MVSNNDKKYTAKQYPSKKYRNKQQVIGGLFDDFYVFLIKRKNLKVFFYFYKKKSIMRLNIVI